MDSVPQGKRCVYQVVRVSGTIRKSEEEAIQRARALIVRAKNEAALASGSSLDDILGIAKRIDSVETRPLDMSHLEGNDQDFSADDST
jgi:hypothetical protein